MKKTKEKLEYLNKLLNVYIRFFKHYNKVKLESNDKMFIVTYYDMKSENSYEFKKEEIPLDDINRYILSTRNKINYYFNKRHELNYII